MADPFRDNPYKIADSVTNAHWNKQHYFLEARILTPEIIRNVRSGIGIKYEVLNGARQIDPRPSDKLIDLEVTPQLIYQYNQWNVGINGHYSRFREDLNISLQNNQLSKNIYKLLGLAEHLFNGPVILSGAVSRFYQGNTYGGGISVSKKINAESFVQLSGYLKSRKEEVTDGTTTPFNAGHHQMTETGGLLTYEMSGNSARHQVSLEARRQNSENTEFVQFLNEETFQYEVLHSAVMHEKTSNTGGVSYHVLLMNSKQAVSWKLGADITYSHFNEVYPSTASKMVRNHLLFSAHAGKSFALRSFTLYAGYNATFKKVGTHDLWFTPNPNTSNFVANQIMYPNYYFNTSDALSHQAHVQLTLPAFEKRQSQLYFKAEYENTSPVGNQPMLPAGLSNHFFNITVGLYN